MRGSRERSESGIYHVILRGINRQDILYDEDDNQHFLETVDQMKSEDQFAVLGYCLMMNHVHLLIQEHTDTISRIMSRIGTSYAWWYNRKYGRSGYVFQGRYGSECVENDEYLLTVIRYIHNNPVKAGLVQNPEDYRWSSIRLYYGTSEYPYGMCEPTYVLDVINKDRQKVHILVRQSRPFRKMGATAPVKMSHRSVCRATRNAGSSALIVTSC